MARLERLQSLQEGIDLKLVSIHDQIAELLSQQENEEENERQGRPDQDAEMADAELAHAVFGTRSKFRSKDSRLLEIANLKLKYEDQLE